MEQWSTKIKIITFLVNIFQEVICNSDDWLRIPVALCVFVNTPKPQMLAIISS